MNQRNPEFFKRSISKQSKQFEDGFVIGANLNGSFDIKVGGREFPYEGVFPVRINNPSKIAEGDSVRVGFVNGNPQMPFIFSRSGRPFGRKEGVVNAGIVDIDPIATVPGLWLQHFGGWWNPHGQSLNPINAFDGPFQQPVIGGPVVFEETSPGISFTIHFPVQAKIFPSDSWTVYADATPYSDETGTPYANAFIGSQGPRLDLGIPINHSVMTFTTPYTGSEVWTADYLPSDSPFSIKLLSTTYNSDAATKGHYFEGLVLFPDGIDQKVATLETIYQAGTPVTSYDPFSETIYFVTLGNEDPPYLQIEGLYFNPTHEPYIPGSPTYDYVIESSLNANDPGPPGFGGVEIYAYSPSTFGLARTIDVGEQLDLYYLYASGTNYGVENLTADGVADTFLMPTNGGQDMYLAGSLGTISGPRINITDLQVVKVNGIGIDPSTCSFELDAITLPFVPNNGDSLDFEFDYEDLSYSATNYGYFEFSGNPTGFVPIDSNNIPFRHLLNADHNGSMTSISEYISINSDNATFSVNVKFIDGDYIGIDYQYGNLLTDYYDINALRIYETKDPGGPTLQLNVPISPVVSAHSINPYDEQMRPYQNSNFSLLRSLSLFYDPSTDTYTIAGPTGIIWRSRVVLTDPAPSPPTPAAHYKLTAWPDDGLADSPRWVPSIDNPYVYQVIPRRSCPWFGFSASGDLGIQATWHNTGGSNVPYDNPEDSVGESNFLIRFWRRDATTRAWAQQAAVPITSYVEQGITGPNLLVIESGTTGPFGTRQSPGTWGAAAFPEMGQGLSFPAYNPGRGHRSMIKNRKAWLLPVSWLKMKSSYSGPFGAQIGYEEAGFTLNAVNPLNGQILHQFNVRSNKDNPLLLHTGGQQQLVNEIVSDYTLSGREYRDVLVDKYVNGNMAYWPPLSGPNPAPPHHGIYAYSAEQIWNSEDQYGFVACFTTTITAGVGPYHPDLWLGYPPPPCLSGSQDNIQVDEVVEGEDTKQYLYFALNIPHYQRWQDEFYGEKWTTRTYTQSPKVIPSGGVVSYPTGVTPPGVFVPILYAYNESDNIVICSNISKLYVNGVDTGPVIYPPTILGFAERLHRVYYARGATLIGADPGNPGYDLWEYEAFTYHLTWSCPIPNPDYSTTLQTFYPRPFAAPNFCFEFPTFLGFQCSPQGDSGLRVYSSYPIRRKVYQVVDKTYLFKMEWSEAAGFTELWRKDITQFSDAGGYFGDTYPRATQTPYGETCYFTIARGRMIFTLRRGTAVEPPVVVNGAVQNVKIFLDAYENINTEPARLHHIELPQITFPTNAYPRQMTVDVDSNGKECVNIWYDGTAKMHVVRFGGPTISSPPTVIEIDDFENTPNGFNSGPETLARNLTDYYWRSYEHVRKHTPL